MPGSSSRILGVWNLGEHPSKDVVAIPEMMFQRGSHVRRHQQHEQHHQDMMHVFRDIHDRPACRERKRIEWELRPGQDAR